MLPSACGFQLQPVVEALDGIIVFAGFCTRSFLCANIIKSSSKGTDPRPAVSGQEVGGPGGGVLPSACGFQLQPVVEALDGIIVFAGFCTRSFLCANIIKSSPSGLPLPPMVEVSGVVNGLAIVEFDVAGTRVPN